MKSRLDNAASIAILVVAVLFVAFQGRQEYERFHRPAPAGQTPLVGRTVILPGVNFNPQGQPQTTRTLILAISTTCHFCKDSEPFYQGLAAHNRGKVRMVAVLPQSLAEAQSYVRKSIAPSVQVVSSGLDSIGVQGTPTLLLVDGRGKVQQAWVGKLSEQGQKEVEAVVM